MAPSLPPNGSPLPRTEPPRRIAVVTAVAGGKDVLRDPTVETGGADFFAFTDRPLPELKVWQTRPLPLWSDDPKYGPRRNAKIPKVIPELLLPGYDYFVWIDGNVDLLMRPDVLCRELLDERGAEFAALPHRLRDCVYDEARAVIQWGLDHPALVRAQMREYRRRGHPRHGGLFELMFILRRNTVACRRLSLSWLEQISRYSSRDQLSFPVALRGQQIAFAPITPGHCLDNPYIKLRGHEVKHAVTPWSLRLKRWIRRTVGEGLRCLRRNVDGQATTSTIPPTAPPMPRLGVHRNDSMGAPIGSGSRGEGSQTSDPCGLLQR